MTRSDIDKYEREADEAAADAKRMTRDDLESHYVCAVTNWQIVLDDRDRESAAHAATKAELAEARETIKRLNRRCQVAEAGVAEKIKNSGGSLGRALAGAAYATRKARLAEAEALLRRMVALWDARPAIIGDKYYAEQSAKRSAERDAILRGAREVLAKSEPERGETT